MGPTVSILLPYSPDEQDRAGLEDFVRTLDQNARSSDDFHVVTTLPVGGSTSTTAEGGGRPFSVRFSDPGEAEEEESLRQIQNAFSFWPVAEIQVAAGSNAEIDHRILGELAAFLAKHFGGIVNFGGELDTPHTNSGQLLRVRYVTASGGGAVFHVGDLTFLKEWLRDSRFHMCK